MENLLYLTLQLSNGNCIEHIVLSDRKESAIESIIADNKWRKPVCIYINKVCTSITGILIKGDYIDTYQIR